MQHTKLFIPIEGPTEFISMINPLILESEDIIQKYLYVKQHSVTKLLYFGVTIQDPTTYHGSGTYWNLHCKKHSGKEFVKTLCVWTFNCQSDCTKFALEFSEDNNIVESSEWANLIHEDAMNGGCIKGIKRTDKNKKKLSDANKNRYQNMTNEEREIEKQKKSAAITKWNQNRSQEEKDITRRKKSDGQKKRYSNYEERLKTSVATKAGINRRV